MNSTLCNLDLGTSDTCDIAALMYAVAHPEVFTLSVEVTENISSITRECPTRPCYMASVRVAVPLAEDDEGNEAEDGEGAAAGAYVYTARINSNRDTTVKHEDTTRVAPCL